MDRAELRTKKTVPIFDAVEHDGPTVVMNNGHPVCVLLSPKTV